MLQFKTPSPFIYQGLEGVWLFSKLKRQVQDAICNNLFADDETMAKSEVKNLNKALAIINKLMKS